MTSTQSNFLCVEAYDKLATNSHWHCHSASSVVALDATGTLHTIDPASSDVVWSTSVAMGHDEFPAEEANAFYPFIDTAVGNVYVADPGSGAIVMVNTGSGEIVSTFDVGGRPARVIVVAVSGVEH